MIIKNTIVRLHSRLIGKPAKTDHIQLTTLYGDLFAASGILLSLVSIIFFYKGCIEHSKLDYVCVGYGFFFVLFAILAILSSIKINDLLIKRR